MSTKQYKLNLPEDVDSWVEKGANESLRSKSAEIVFHLRRLMEKEKADATAS